MWEKGRFSECQNQEVAMKGFTESDIWGNTKKQSTNHVNIEVENPSSQQNEGQRPALKKFTQFALRNHKRLVWENHQGGDSRRQFQSIMAYWIISVNHLSSIWIRWGTHWGTPNREMMWCDIFLNNCLESCVVKKSSETKSIWRLKWS